MKKTIVYISIFVITFIFIDQVVGRFLLHGINRFYGLNQHSEILLIGHSHLMLAIDKDKLESETGMMVSKYTREGVNVVDRYTMVKQYIQSPFSDSLKMVLYGVDQFTFTSTGLSENSYKLFYPFIDNPIMDEYIKESANDKMDYYTHKVFQLTRYSDALINASLRGYRNDYSNYKYGILDVESYKKTLHQEGEKFDRQIVRDSTLVSVFEKTIELITDKGIKVILVNTPVIDLLNKQSPEKYTMVIDYYKRLTEVNQLVEYWDYNPQYSSDYSIFYDPIHLNPKGQELITGEIIQRLKYNDK